MYRWAVLLSLVACAPPGDAAPEPPVAWRYAPAAVGFPLGAVTGRIGRSQAPQAMAELGIAGGGDDALAGVRRVEPLRQPSAWPIPGPGPARAAVYGSVGDRAAIELIELDVERGRVAWRDETTCAAPIVAATAAAIVCTDIHGTRAVGLDGKPRWAVRAPFLAVTGERVILRSEAGVAVVDADSGSELARLALPRGVLAETVIASCGAAGRELFAASPDGKLVAIGDARGGPAVRWSVPLGVIRGVDTRADPAASAAGAGASATGVGSAAGAGSAGAGSAGGADEMDDCDPILVAAVQAPSGLSLVAIARATGKIVGRVDGVLGRWPAREGGGLEVATARGVARYPRTLDGAQPLDLPPLGELIAERGDQRLVRATPATAVVLDRAGVRAYVPFAAIGGVLGDRTLLAASWTGAPSETLHRFALPPRWPHRLRLARRAGVALAAELRDLPEPRALELVHAAALPDTGARGVAAYALDPADGAALYAVALDPGRAAVARADLAARRWRWQRVDGCATGEPIALAVGRDVVVCATRGAVATVRATSRDGVPRWDWTTDAVDAVTAAGDAVLVHAADRLAILDAGDGHVLGRLASDDTAAVRAAALALPAGPGEPGAAIALPADETADDAPAARAATVVIAAERGRVVARLARGLWPLWSVEVAGAVAAIWPAGDAVVVALDDGDAYRLDARTGAATALPGLGLAWHPWADVVAGATRGGPIPAPSPPPPPPTTAQILRKPLQILRIEVTPPPPMSTPITPPPPLGDSWQLTLYDPAGGVRARNDYALAPPIAAAPRGPAGSPIVVTYGRGEAMVLEPRTGDPLRRVALPDDAAVFGTVVEGSPVAGALLGAPLRVVQF